MNSLSYTILAVCIVAMALSGSADAFTTGAAIQSRATVTPAADSQTALGQFGKKKQEEDDLSWMETRDMTREEMLELNARNTQVMNNELGAMTAVSVLFSLPVFYLCWVAFFSD